MAGVIVLSESFLVESYCGGSIVNSKWIITARHCIQPINSFITNNASDVYPLNRVGVRIGEHQISSLTETNMTKNYYPVEKIVASPIDDLALIKVTGDIDTSIYSPICLPETGDNFRSMDGVLIGWGKNMSVFQNDTSPSNFPDSLQEITLPILSADECTKYYLERLNKSGIDLSNITEPIVAFFLCAGGEINRNGCFGDSGGPLMVQTEGKQSWTLAGIVSGGEEPCAKEGGYGLFVDVTYHLDFIKTTAADGEFCD